MKIWVGEYETDGTASAIEFKLIRTCAVLQSRASSLKKIFEYRNKTEEVA